MLDEHTEKTHSWNEILLLVNRWDVALLRLFTNDLGELSYAGQCDARIPTGILSGYF